MNRENKSIPAKDVNEYLASLPKKQRISLERLREAIKEAAPEAEETISYRIPSYKYKGSLVHFAAFKNHSSFIVVNKSILDIFKSELENFYTSGATIRFSSENPLPEALVKKIVKKRIEQNENKSKK